VHGAVIGDGCLVGISALVLNGAVMGEGSWLAAGSVLPEGKEIPPWTLAVGVPARPLRELTEEEIERQRSGVRTYLELRDLYRRSMGSRWQRQPPSSCPAAAARGCGHCRRPPDPSSSTPSRETRLSSRRPSAGWLEV